MSQAPRPHRRPIRTCGWAERIDFPEWGLVGVRAKIDTGARTSALDVVDYALRNAKGGILVVELRLALDRRRPELHTIVHTPVMRMVSVCSSSGCRELRPLVETTLRLGSVSKVVRLTVTSRTTMRFPMILGRSALRDDFLVDVSRKYLLDSRRRRTGR